MYKVFHRSLFELKKVCANKLTRNFSVSVKNYQNDEFHQKNLENVSDFTLDELVNTNANGKVFLGRMRYVRVHQFMGRLLVDIREHYEKDGEIKPGNKGIALRYQEWKQLKNNIDLIDEKVESVIKEMESAKI